jgi:hypothetical protein
MGIELTSLREIDTTLVAATEKLLKALIGAYAPGIDTNGALHQLLIRPHAVLYSATRTEVDRLRRASSLYALARDPALASQEVVDAAMSNFALQRRQATRASCMLTLTFSSLSTVVIPNTAVFGAGGMEWTPEAAYTAMDAAGVGERVLAFAAHPSGVGYWVQLPVFATTAGNVDVVAGAEFSIPAIPNLIGAVAAGAAAGGADAESNEELVARAIASISPVSLSTRDGVERYVRQADRAITAVTVIGYGDQELSRSRHNMFSVSTPGMADIYVRTAVAPHVDLLSTRGFVRVTREQLSMTSVRTAFDVRVEVTGYTHAGAYEVVGVMMAPPDGSGVSPSDAFDQGLAFRPHRHERVPAQDTSAFAPTPADAAFSAAQGTMYATASIPFSNMPASEAATVSLFLEWQSYWRNWYISESDETTEEEKLAALPAMAAAMVAMHSSTVSSEFTAEFNVWAWVAAMPGLAALQSAVVGPAVKAPVDYLVRAYVPCWVTVGLRLRYYGSSSAIDTDAVSRAVVAAVSGTSGNATRGVRASDIAVAVTGVVGTAAVLDMPLTLTGRLRLPTDDVIEIESGTELKIPEGYEAEGVSPRTAAFYITESDVAIELRAAT